MMKQHSIALISLAVNLTLAPGEYVTVHAQHGFTGAAFTISNESEVTTMSTVSVCSAIRERLDAAGFSTVRIGQVITAMFAGSPDAEPLVSIDGKGGAIAASAASFPLYVPVADDSSARLQGVVIGALVSAVASHVLNDSRHRPT